jgi:hypothetical protein
VPDLQIDGPHYELKGIRVDSSNANYNGGLRSTGYSTGVTEASCRSHASGSGARGFDADSWGAGYGGDVGRADRYAGD